MSGHSHRLYHRSRIALLAAISITGVVLSGVGYWILTSKENRLVRAQLEADAEQRGRTIERRFRTDVLSVFALSPFVSERGAGTREDFRRLADGVLGSNQDLASLIWIPRVRANQQAAHEAAMRAQGLPEYRIKPRGAAAAEGAGPPRGGDLFPIAFAEPRRRNTGKAGLDLASLPALGNQIGQIADSRSLTVTGPILWIDDDRQFTAVVVFRPVFEDPAASDNAAIRREKLTGLLAAVIRVEALIQSGLYVFRPEIDVRLYDDAASEGRAFVCAFDAESRNVEFQEPEDDSANDRFEPVPRMALDVPGRGWVVEFRPTKSYIARHTGMLPWVVFGFGALLTAVLTTHANTLMGRTSKVEQLVVQRTAELARERFLLDTLLKHSPDYIYFKDEKSRFIRVSNALAGYFGLGSPGEAVGKTDFDFFHPDSARQYRDDEREVMQKGQPVVNKEEQQFWSDGRVRWLSTTKVPLFVPDGSVIGTFGISRDVTVQKRAAEEERRARDAAEAASRAKSDFLANMSHEIRTPMNAIIGMTELVLDTELSHSQREYLTLVQASAESLLAILNDVLDFSKIEAGKLELHAAPLDLDEELSKVLKSLSLKAHAKGLELACRIRPGTPLRLIGDASRLRQIVVNLLSNAIKFTERGEVVLAVEGRSSTAEQTTLHFAVTDTGIGIAPEKLTRIFGAFEQADTSTTRRYGGTGLGLTISSRLVELLGGEIWAESELGRGSTFHFTARLMLPSNGAAPPPVESRLSTPDAHVLVVDDNDTNCRILEEVLAHWGMKPVCAGDAREAVRLLRDAQRCGRPYDLVLTDANMPETDGFELARLIKDDPQLGSTVIMMLTSGDRPGDIARCEQLGVAAYLLKPIHQSELLECIVAALGTPSLDNRPVSAEAAEATSSLRPLRILLAEDSLVNQKLAVGLLSKYGHSVIVANDGNEALSVLRAQEVDVVLMDVQMPGMDGFDATAAIRAQEKLTGKHVPILAMTAHAMKGDRERCLEAGMDDYVAKPISASHLLAKISAVMALAIRPA